MAYVTSGILAGGSLVGLPAWTLMEWRREDRRRRRQRQLAVRRARILRELEDGGAF